METHINGIRKIQEVICKKKTRVNSRGKTRGSRRVGQKSILKEVIPYGTLFPC